MGLVRGCIGANWSQSGGISRRANVRLVPSNVVNGFSWNPFTTLEGTCMLGALQFDHGGDRLAAESSRDE